MCNLFSPFQTRELFLDKVLTLLSYFYDGLNTAELKQAFEMLLACDESVQEDHYKAFFFIL